MHAVNRLAHRRLRPAAASPQDDRSEAGAVLVVSVIVMLSVLAITALVIDIGYAKQSRRLAQNTADAAALAAAQDLDGTAPSTVTAVASARSWAQKNDPDLTTAAWSGCTDADALPVRPDPATTCISFSADRMTVRVRLPMRDQPVFFGGVIRSDPLEVEAVAVATKTLGSTPSMPAGPCGLCVIEDRTLQIGGSTSIQVTGGEIQADRLTANAQDGNNGIAPVPLRWHTSNTSNWGRNVQPAPATFNSRYQRLTAAVPNPFAALSVDYTGLVTDGSNINYSSGPSPLQPNRIYTQNINVQGGTLNLAPGTYYFANTLNVTNGARLTGTGVTLVFACAAPCTSGGSEPGKFNFSNGTTVTITAPTTGPYAGLAILFDPNGRQGTPNQLSGNITLEGAVYGRRAGFNMGSSSGVVRAWTIVAGGNFDANAGTLIIDNTAYAATVGGGGGGSSGTEGSVNLTG